MVSQAWDDIGNKSNGNSNQAYFWSGFEYMPSELKSKVTTKLSTGLESKLMKVE